MSIKGLKAIFFVMLAFVFVSTIVSCAKIDQPKFTTDYQAIFLNNGQVFFAKIENVGSDYPLLKDVFYVQTRVNPETKQPASVLIKRGNEWHGPDYMYVSAKHIVAIEPVSANSKVAQLIKEANTQKAPPAQP